MRNFVMVVAGPLCLAFLVFGTELSAQETDESAKLIEVRKIWDKAPHNAFTDRPASLSGPLVLRVSQG